MSYFLRVFCLYNVLLTIFLNLSKPVLLKYSFVSAVISQKKKCRKSPNLSVHPYVMADINESKLVKCKDVSERVFNFSGLQGCPLSSSPCSACSPWPCHPLPRLQMIHMYISLRSVSLAHISLLDLTCVV